MQYKELTTSQKNEMARYFGQAGENPYRTFDRWVKDNNKGKIKLLNLMTKSYFSQEKIMIEVTVKGEQIKFYSYDTKVTFWTTYNEQLSYVANVLSVYRDYAITEYLIDEDDEEKSYFELVKIV